MKLLRFVIFTLFLLMASLGRASFTSQTNRAGPYTASVLPATVSVVFPFQQASDILVLDLGQGGTSNDPPVTLTLNSDYTVTGGGYNPTTNMQSGNVVVVTGGAHNVQVNDQIMVLRNVPVNQISSLVSGILTAAAIEKALDKQATLSQQLTEVSLRSMHFEAGETVDGTMLRSARAGKLLGFDAAGNISFSTGGGGSGTTYTAGAGMLLAANVFSVNPVQSLTSLTVVNPIVGSLAGNAATASALQTARSINGVNFDGTSNITVTAAAGTLTGVALPVAVTSAPGLTGVALGTLGTMAIQNATGVAITGGSITGAVVTGLSTPVATTDAANKAYVDAVAAGAVPRTAVVAGTVGNITLSGPQTIDGQSIIAGNRVLVKNQTLPAQNGIYDCAAGAWTRSLDSDTAAELKVGFYYFVTSGTTLAATSWFISTAPVVVNTDPVVFSQYSAAQVYTAGVGLTLAANQFSVNASQPQITTVGTLGSLNVAGTIAATTLNASGAGTFGTTLGVTGAAIFGNTINSAGVNTIDIGTGALPPSYPSATSKELVLISDDANAARMFFVSFGNQGNSITGDVYGGSRASPGATVADAILLRVGGSAFDGSVFASNAREGFYADGVQSGSNHGGYARWDLTAAGATAQTLNVMRLDGTGLFVNPGGVTVATVNSAGLVVTGKTTTSTENKSSYSVFTGALGAYDSASGALYVGYTAGASFLRSVTDNAGTAAPISIQVGNGTQVGIFTTLGLQGDLGQGTPGLGKFTTISWLDNASLRATKTNAHIIFNVRDFGAIGDGASNDTAAINSAIAALTNYSTLYFPAGSYLVTPGSINAIASLNHITIMGDGRGSQITSVTAGAAGNFLVVNSTCDHVTLRDFSIVGAATVRGSGVGIRMNASYALVSNLYIFGTSDFGILISNDAASTSTNVIVEGCLSDRTLGDGFHFGAISDGTLTNCQAYFTGDDGVGIGDDGAVGRPATRIEVNNFQSIQAGNHAGGGTHGAGIRIFDGAVDVHVVGGAIYQSCEAGLATGRFSSTTAFNTRVSVVGLKVYQCLQNAGMYANLNFQWTNQLSVKDCWSEAPVSQGCYSLLDCNNVTFQGNTAKDAVVRAFVTDDGTTTNVAATCSNWTIMGNICLGTPSNESYYFVAPTGKTITNLILTGNTETGQSTANYIFTNRIAGFSKVNNNTSGAGKAVANGGSGVVNTVANNN